MFLLEGPYHTFIDSNLSAVDVKAADELKAEESDIFLSFSNRS